MQIVKLGGSIITNKREVLSGKTRKAKFHRAMARRLLKEVQDSGQRVILVAGGGSFGHYKADKYGLKDGFKEDSQWDGFVEVARDVRALNLMMLDEAFKLGMRVISVPPSVIALQVNKRIHFLEEGVFKRYIDKGITPLTFGDVSLDMELGFSICGGDAVMQRLSKVFRVERAIFVSDVDGIFMKPDKHLAEVFTPGDTENIYPMKKRGKGKPGDGDVTGGIRTKAQLALAMAKDSTEVAIINGKVKGRLLDALKGGRPKGTWFKR
jgi:isopentenyl phosphate kinase